jgi:quinol monooxygenase YgiN
MNYLTVLFQGTAKPGHENTVREALMAVITATRAEADCIAYELHVDQANPANFICYEQWVSEEALQRHLETPHIQKLAQILWPLLQETPAEAIFRLTPIRPAL